MDPTIIEDTETALCEELDEIARRRRAASVGVGPDWRTDGQTFAQRAAVLEPTALCLSGGGIRSAAFCLGVLQALGACRLLNQFDYVSTVSGGGFIGGWLQMLIRETGDIKKVEDALGQGTAPALHRLRGFTNYLTPESGVFSADTWAGIVLYLRNMIINWMVFAPAFLLLALAAIFYRSILYALHADWWVALGCLAVATLSLTAGTWEVCTTLPSHRAERHARFADSKAIWWRIVAPALIWAVLVPFAVEYDLASYRTHAANGWWGRLDTQWVVPALYAVAMVAGYGAAWVQNLAAGHKSPDLYRINAVRWLMATVVVAFMTGIFLHLIQPGGVFYEAALVKLTKSGGPLLVNTPTALAVVMPLALVGAHLLHTTFYVAFRREGLIADLDREWLARVSGLTLRIGSATTVLAVCCLVLPPLLSLVGNKNGFDQIWTIATGGGATVAIGGPAAWLGKKLASQIEAVAEESGSQMTWLLNVLALAFAVGLLATSGAAVEFALGQVQLHLKSIYAAVFGFLPFGLGDLPVDPRQSVAVPIILQAILAAVLLALVVGFGGVNVNRFSLNAVYRSRLARAFLGTAREHRRPDPFTGFDQEDNERLIHFLDNSANQRLFPVINTTLNVTSTSNTAWAERMAESFTATPLRCGAGALHLRHQTVDEAAAGAFARTSYYAGKDSEGDKRGTRLGPRIGSMVTISGAAISPNWGYHSSPTTAFLMTLFNARLGAWLPNPAHSTEKELCLAKPRNSLIALISELLGMSTDTSQAVYLSDGGHFENLGVYEMLRRRCRLIVMVDAGQDGDCTFFDLGTAIRTARIDLGADVRMGPMRIYPRTTIETNPTLAASALGFAVGTVDYLEGGRGRLIYLKPSFLPDIPADVRAYGLSNASFPHVTTSDQAFTESEFESYRALGAWQMGQLTKTMLYGSLRDLFDTAEKLAQPPGSGQP